MRLFAHAFPLGFDIGKDYPVQTGMHLRDYFAIRIVQSVHPENVAMNDEQRKQAAEYAYQMADSMMVAREA